MIFSQNYKAHWTLFNKLLFRAVFTYFTLYLLLLFLSPFLGLPLEWFAENILNWGAGFKMESTGSGDRTFDYLRLAFNVLLTIPIIMIWSVLDRKKASYNKLNYSFQLILRITLFFVMLLYGIAKLFKAQFADHSLEHLVQTIGELSPMGLAWTFMGHSLYYNIFIGFTEILGGMLLLFRKTVTLASIIIIGVMTNVFIMNLNYDIPVKLVSAHIILMASVLLLANGQRAFNFFFRNTAIEPVAYYHPLKSTRFKKQITIGKWIIASIIMSIICVQLFVRFNFHQQIKDKSEFYGLWETQYFVSDQDTLPPLLTDNYRWRYLIIETKKKAVIKKMNDAIERFQLLPDTTAKQITLSTENDSVAYRFSYHFNNPQNLELNGMLEGGSIHVLLKQKPITDFRLMNRKFHWLNETTYNY